MGFGIHSLETCLISGPIVNVVYKFKTSKIVTLKVL